MIIHTDKSIFFRKCYEIGFCRYNPDIITGGNKYENRFVKNTPKDKWYADPFLFEITDSCFILFVEEFRYDHPVGR